uniref:hypothetical protein n=1 Tax=Agathobacter sp. TaxID=2021311 RepID=UPI0040568DF0
MRLKAKEKIICCIFAVILLVLGMCSGMGADSSFVCDSFVSATDAIYSAEKISQREEVCTNDMLRKEHTVYLRSNAKRSFSKISFGITALNCIVALGLQYLFYFGKAAHWVCEQKRTSHAFTVRYIHRQDGEK